MDAISGVREGVQVWFTPEHFADYILGLLATTTTTGTSTTTTSSTTTTTTTTAGSELLTKIVVVLDNDDIKAAAGTPHEIVPPPGSGKLVIPILTVLDYRHNGDYTGWEAVDHGISLNWFGVGVNDEATPKIADGENFLTDPNIVILPTRSDVDLTNGILTGFLGLQSWSGHGLSLVIENDGQPLTGGDVANTLTVTVYYVTVDVP